MERIRRLIADKVVFHCRPRAGGFSSRDFEIVHTLDKPGEPYDYPDWMPPSMQTVLSEFGAMRLFQPSEGTDDGFRLFSPDECLRSLLLFRESLRNASEVIESDDIELTDEDVAWIAGLCPIAEVMASGDYFAIDTENARADGECPVVYLDHELYFAGSLQREEADVVADDVIQLIEKVLDDPLEYLASYWTGGDPYDQWFPESISRSA